MIDKPLAYIAGPIFNPRQVAVMESITIMANEAGFDVFNPYTASREIWKGRRPKDCTPEERQKVLHQNYSTLDKADVLVCWLNGRFDDGRADTGVTWEMGYFFAQQMFKADEGLLSIGYLSQNDALPKELNLMLAGTLDALCTTPSELRRALWDARDITQRNFNEYAEASLESHEFKNRWRDQFSPERVDLHESQEMGLAARMTASMTPTEIFDAEPERVPTVTPDNRHVPGAGSTIAGDIVKNQEAESRGE